VSLDLAAFQRVEVQRGPAAVMYSNYLGMDFAGSQTPLAGITNYVLRDRVDTPLTRIQAGFGSWATANVQAYHQGRTGELHYFMGGSWERSDYRNYGTPGSWLNILDDPFDHGYGTINATYQGLISDTLDLQAKAGARLYGRRWGEDLCPASLALREHDGVDQNVFPADVTLTWRHSGEGRLTFGSDAQYATYKTYAEADAPRTTGNDATASSAGLFAQEQLVLGDLVLRGGLRYGHSRQSYTLLGGVAPGVPDKSWDKLLWSTGVRWNGLGPVALFANAGSSFVAPTPKAVGGTLQVGDLGVPGRNGQLPNPGLRPESGIGGDLGLDLSVHDTLQVNVRGFLNRIDDVIVDNVVSQNPSQTRSINAGDARSYGVEVAFDQALGRRVRWFANATYTHSRVQNPIDPTQDGAEIPFVPDWMANVGASLVLPHGFTMSPYLRAVGTYYDSTSLSGRQSFGECVVPAVRLRAAVTAGARSEVVFALDLNNLVDDRYAMPWQFRDPGFNLFASVALRLR
jgi:iron complex outermembrane recepter protein